MTHAPHRAGDLEPVSSYPTRPPILSVVVTVVEGGSALARTLEALATQIDPPAMEVVVPWDDADPPGADLAARFPEVRFLPLGAPTTARPWTSAAGQHELHDRRRAAGLAAAFAELVALLEDRAQPGPTWARTMVALHQERRAAAIGGAIEPGVTGRLAWAVYFSDFGGYQNPVTPGPVEELSDINVCYRREALEAIRPVWAPRYHETSVHAELRRRGQTLWLSEQPVVTQRLEARWSRALLAQRRDWGRLFASIRAQGGSGSRRLLLALGAPALPAILLVRHARTRHRRRASIGPFWLASPALLLLLAAWSWGELLGYLTARE